MPIGPPWIHSSVGSLPCAFAGRVTKYWIGVPSVEWHVQCSTSTQSGNSKPDRRASTCGGESGWFVTAKASGGSRKVERMPTMRPSFSTCTSL